MTPDAAVALLAEIIVSQQWQSEHDLYTAMLDRDVPANVAERAYKFTLFAWGRVLLEGVGVRWSPDYLCFNAAGEVIESGRIAEEPFFAAAARLAPRYAHSPAFRAFAAMSSDVQSTHSAIHKGSRPQDLISAPAATFLEPPTPEGMQAARTILLRYTYQEEPAPQGQKPRKPWWRFWG